MDKTKNKTSNIVYAVAVIMLIALVVSLFANVFNDGNASASSGSNNDNNSVPPISDENTEPNPDDNTTTLPDDMKPGYLKAGVWEFKDNLTTYDSNLRLYPQSLRFFMPYREDIMYFDVFYLDDDGDGLLRVDAHEYTGEYAATSYTLYDEQESQEDCWKSKNYPACKQITFKSDQKVDEVFYNWFIENATYVRDNTYDILWYNDKEDVTITPFYTNPTTMTYGDKASLRFDWVSTSNYTMKVEVQGCDYEVTTTGNGGTSGSVYITLSNPDGALSYENPYWYVKIFFAEDSCFVAGTPVLMEDGTKKAIETVVVGDKVLTYNEETKVFETGYVVGLITHTQITEMARLTFSDGTVIEMSSCHPIGTVDGYKSLTGYKDLPLLEVGNFVITANGELIELVSIECWTVSTPVVTYNLDVEDNDNYFVGDTPILVHNKGEK